MIYTRTVTDPKGMHFRPSLSLVNACRHLDYTLNGQAIETHLDVLSLGIKQGETLTFEIHCEGSLRLLKRLVF